MDETPKRSREENNRGEESEQDARRVVESQHLILEALPTATLMTRPDGSIVYTNRRFNDQFGAEIAQTGNGIADFYADPLERQIVIETILRKGYVDDYELRVRKADGNLAWVLLSARRFKFAGETVILSSLFDITERKRVDEELRDSEERFARLSAATSEGIGITDKDIIVDANPQLASMMGYNEPAELVGMKALDFVATGSRDLVVTKA